MNPFDAVLLIAFGGPNGIKDIRPFLKNVLRGRRVSPERVETVAHHYEMFDGVSPITELTHQQAVGLRKSLKQRNLDLPVYVGMRNWHPFLSDTLWEMAGNGIRRAIGFIMAGHQCFSSCGQYKENILQAQLEVLNRGRSAPTFTYVGSWYNHPGFIATNTQQIEQALEKLPKGLQSKARILFTAHSIPQSMADTSQYRKQLIQSAQLTAKTGQFRDWALVFQSRSGRPEDPWLEPDIGDYLKTEHPKGLDAVVVCPIGFISDHVEVLYDLDYEAAGISKKLKLPMVRAQSANSNPLFLNMMADVVEATCKRYTKGLPLNIAALKISK